MPPVPAVPPEPPVDAPAVPPWPAAAPPVPPPPADVSDGILWRSTLAITSHPRTASTHAAAIAHVAARRAAKEFMPDDRPALSIASTREQLGACRGPARSDLRGHHGDAGVRSVLV